MKIADSRLNIQVNIIILEVLKVNSLINSSGPLNSNKRSNTEIRANMVTNK